jgi:hypothetical protein
MKPRNPQKRIMQKAAWVPEALKDRIIRAIPKEIGANNSSITPNHAGWRLHFMYLQ